MTGDDGLYEEIDDLRVELVEFREVVEKYYAEQPRRNRIARIERIQIGVAIAVLTGYLTLQTSSGFNFAGSPIKCIGDSGFHCAVSFQAMYGGVFLLAKVSTMTIRPILEQGDRWFEVIQNIDDQWLPAAYLPFIFGSVTAGLGLLSLPDLRFPFFTVIYIGLEIVILYTLGRWYADHYSDTMEQIRSSSTDSTVTVTSSPSGSSTFFKIENTSDHTFEEGDVRFIVEAEGASVDEISQAYLDDSVDSDDVWIYAHDLDPGIPKRIPISIVPEEGSVEMRTVRITIEIQGQDTATEEFQIFG